MISIVVKMVFLIMHEVTKVVASNKEQTVAIFFQ